MNFNFEQDFWKLVLLVIAAVMNYSAGFVSGKFAEDEQKQTTIKITLKIIAFILAIFTAIAVVFL